jgi:hypothetical protein
MKHQKYRSVWIALEVDPTLVQENDSWSRIRSRMYKNFFRLRLVPCKGGVRLGWGASRIYRTPESLAGALCSRALDWSIRAGEAYPGTATWQYREDRWRFYLAAARAVREDPRCLGLWGEECAA